MDIKIFKTQEEASLYAADLLTELIRNKPDAVLGLATGSTPEPVYAELVRRHKEEGLDFSRIKTINLDEYVGLSGDHDQSYRYFMNHHLFDHVNIDKANTNVPNGLAADPEAECKAYDEKWAALGGTDVQVLGMGPNGHVGFNEPGDHLVGGTHLEDLTDETVEANSRFFASIDDVPRKALTMGMNDIMGAKQIIMIAFGPKKAAAVSAFADDKITCANPSTFVKMHPNAVLIVDEEAAAGLK